MIVEAFLDSHNRLYSRSIPRGRLIRNKQPASFYITTRGALLCCRIMGFLPLTGLTNHTSDKLR